MYAENLSYLQMKTDDLVQFCKDQRDLAFPLAEEEYIKDSEVRGSLGGRRGQEPSH